MAQTLPFCEQQPVHWLFSMRKYLRTRCFNENHNQKPVNNTCMSKLKLTFVINLGLLVFTLAMSFSGFVIQFGFHMGHDSAIMTDNSFLGLGYNNWTNIHKISIIIISFLATYHFILHWKWYKMILIKKLASKNKQQIILSIVFISVAITGYFPWILDLSSGSEILRKSFIEIHDKISVLLFVLLAIHITNRLKWYINSIKRLSNKHTTSEVVS